LSLRSEQGCTVSRDRTQRCSHVDDALVAGPSAGGFIQADPEEGTI
jgi:hypothetical protein